MEALEAAISSPWVYLVVFIIAALDAFFPIVPSETLVITAGVFAAGGGPALVPVIAAAAAGAFLGDHIAYQLGRSGGSALLRRLRAGRRRAAVARIERTLAVRGGLILVVARYIPGGRIATTVTMGAVGYPRRTFALFDVVAAVSWATYSAMIGYLGGVTFERDRLKGLLFGLGLAAAITVVVEVVRFLRQRVAARRRALMERSPATDRPGDEVPPVA